ncbi:MAG: endonuclease [Anaerolineae bacterium]|nr:endonuclease [Anaerolineae bacterium]
MEQTLYDRLIVEVFRRHGGANCDEFEFERDEMADILRDWGKKVRNLGDVAYSYRGGRRPMPEEITSTGNWVIEGRGRGRYAFRRLRRSAYIGVPEDLRAIEMLDATPDIILKYGGTDEQGLLARVRYNRLVDTFLGITAYHVQGHIRAFVQGSGQVEIDDLYLGVDIDGRQYAVPVEAKTAREPLGVVQVVAMNAYTRATLPELTLRPVAVKASLDGSLFFLEFNDALDSESVEVINYRRYRLVREADAQRTSTTSAGDTNG